MKLAGMSISNLRSAYATGDAKPSHLIDQLHDKLTALGGAFVSLVPLKDLQSRVRCAIQEIFLIDVVYS